MPGQIWSVASEGGYLWSEELSTYLRMAVQPMTKFRQFCDAKDGSQKGLNRGDKFQWNVASNLGTQGRRLDERSPIPETGFTLSQKSLTIQEYGNSVPYTGKLNDMAKQDILSIIDANLKHDARKCFDIEAFTQFKATMLRVAPTGGTSTTSVTLTTNGATATTNNAALGTGHVKAMSDMMKERNIPAYMGDDYFMISNPANYRPFKNALENIKLYTETGLAHIFSGEIGRFENTRFIEQTYIPRGGANNATTFDPWAGVGQPWTNGQSSWAFMFGGDTVTEALVIPEELRAKIPGDYGRSRGLAWYAMTGFGIVHDDANNARIVMWDSAA